MQGNQAAVDSYGLPLLRTCLKAALLKLAAGAAWEVVWVESHAALRGICFLWEQRAAAPGALRAAPPGRGRRVGCWGWRLAAPTPEELAFFTNIQGILGPSCCSTAVTRALLARARSASHA